MCISSDVIRTLENVYNYHIYIRGTDEEALRYLLVPEVPARGFPHQDSAIEKDFFLIFRCYLPLGASALNVASHGAPYCYLREIVWWSA